MNRGSIAGIVTASLIAATVPYYAWAKRRWISTLKEYKEKHHGYKTSEHTADDVLLIVNPASGGGKGQTGCQKGVDALEKHERAVEVYVTSGSEDLMTLTQTKDLSTYKMIAVLGGDSTIMELIQHKMSSNKETWPYAPILHLPGGSGNVLTGDAFGPHTTVDDTVKMALNANCVKNANIIKCTSDGSTAYGVQVAFSGFQSCMIETADGIRHGIYAVFGKAGLIFTILGVLVTYPFRAKRTPHMLSVIISDVEAEGMDLGFGSSRWDERGVFTVLYQRQYKGLGNLLKTMGSMMSGKIGKAYQAGETIWDDDLHVEVSSEWTAKGDGPYKIIFDGSTTVSVEGEEVHFTVIPQCLPLYTKG